MGPLGSVVVAGHLFAVLCVALAAPSGPWPTPMGNSNAFGPQFARSVDEAVGPNYLSPIKMTYNYHSPITTQVSLAGSIAARHRSSQAADCQLTTRTDTPGPGTPRTITSRRGRDTGRPPRRPTRRRTDRC